MQNTKLKLIIFLSIFIMATTSVFAASKKSIVCTSFPEYDWVMNILGQKSGNFDVTLLQNNGTDLHSYQPSVKDIAKISKADLFVFVGGESDEWVEKVVEQSVNKNQIIVNMMQALGDKVREEEIVEGMQEEKEEHEHHHHHKGEKFEEHHNNDKKADEAEYDEHIWLSLNNAIELSKILCEKISNIDAANADIYEKNLEFYINQLLNLDEEYRAVVKSSQKNTILLGDRYPFRYLTDDYGLKYYAAFVGCSAESEANFETIIFLANKIDELGLNVVITIEKSNQKIAKTIVENTKNKNQQILEMDSLQSITEKEIKDGKNYLSAMKKNLEVLKKALN